MALRPGCLLVANPLLPDANFDRTVILVLACGGDGAAEEGEGGALGVVLNRPGTPPLEADLPLWASLSSPPGVIYEGGPVSPGSAICVVGVPAASVAGEQGWSPVTGDLATLDLDLGPAAVEGRVSGLRVFAGYAGWGAGQLEAELAAEAWWVLDGRPGDVFSSQPGSLWSRVLRRQGGSLQLVASYPDDPSAN